MKKRKKAPPVESKQSIEDGWAAADYARYGYVESDTVPRELETAQAEGRRMCFALMEERDRARAHVALLRERISRALTLDSDCLDNGCNVCTWCLLRAALKETE